jgi:[ribosomal protein S5]-alanine N-acetyltransferase
MHAQALRQRLQRSRPERLSLPGMNPFLPLQGTRLLLRTMRSSDITPELVAWLNDPAVVRFSNQRFLRHTLDSCHRYLQGFECGPNLYLSARLRATDQAVGTLTVYRNPHHGTADVGILMGERSLWGQGLGLEAFALLADALAAEPGLRKLTCGMVADNRAMVSVAQRAGFVQEAVRRGQELVDGQPADLLHFARFC